MSYIWVSEAKLFKENGFLPPPPELNFINKTFFNYHIFCDKTKKHPPFTPSLQQIYENYQDCKYFHIEALTAILFTHDKFILFHI